MLDKQEQTEILVSREILEEEETRAPQENQEKGEQLGRKDQLEAVETLGLLVAAGSAEEGVSQAGEVNEGP